MSDKTRSNHLLSYPVIVLASGGDVDAINAVLKHYEGYIAALSMRTFYDEKLSHLTRIRELKDFL